MSTLPEKPIRTTVADTAAPTVADTAVLPDAPYRGIESFRFIDQQIFAARAKETWSLLSNSKLYRAVLLYGDSGTGKSSLINAGLLPRAAEEGYVPDRLRIQPFAGREFKVERIRTSGPDKPPVYLPSSFTGLEADGLPADGEAESFELSVTAFRKRIRQFRRTTEDIRQGAPFRAPGTRLRPLLIFDQFEEFITLFEEAQRGGATAEAQRLQQDAPRVQRRVLVTLIKLIRDDRLPVKILFSFREDYLAKLSLLFSHCPQVLNQAIRLLPPQADVLPEIIRAPFADPKLVQHFLRDGNQVRSELSEDLAQKVAAELSHHGVGEVNLTELQIVCLLLWQSPDPEGLFKAQGIRGLLKSYGASVFLHFTPDLRDAAVGLLGEMITASNTRNIIAEEDLLSRAGTSGKFKLEQLRPALLELSRTQIVRRELRRHLYFYEITSEYLVPWIKEQIIERQAAEQRRLAELRAADERKLAEEAQKVLEAQRVEAVKKLEAEHRRAVVFARVLVALMFLLAASVALGYVAYRQWQLAKTAKQEATEARDLTDRVLTAVKLTTSENKDEALDGITKVDALIKEKKIQPELTRVLLGRVLDSTNMEVQQAALKVLIYAAQSDQKLAQSVVQATETNPALVKELSGGSATNFENLTKTLPARLYIHISAESQRADAKRAADALTSNGYIVPGIANVGSKAPKLNELRYFRKDDPGMPAPKAIVDILTNATGAQWVERYTAGYEDSPNIRPGHFEIWFGAAAGSSTGWLNAWAADENDKYVAGLHFTITVTTPQGQVVKRQRSGYTPLPAGDYILKANAQGYDELTIPFSLAAGEDKKVELKFVRKQPRRQSP